jgi:hypothetical protein
VQAQAGKSRRRRCRHPPDAGVQLASFQHRHLHGGHVLAEKHLYVRVLFQKTPHHRTHFSPHSRTYHAQLYPSRLTPPNLFHARQRLIRAGKQTTGLLHQDFSCVGQRYAAGVANKQQRAKLLLQVFNVNAERRLRHVQTGRRTTKMQLFGNSQKIAQ